MGVTFTLVVARAGTGTGTDTGGGVLTTRSSVNSTDRLETSTRCAEAVHASSVAMTMRCPSARVTRSRKSPAGPTGMSRLRKVIRAPLAGRRSPLPKFNFAAPVTVTGQYRQTATPATTPPTSSAHTSAAIQRGSVRRRDGGGGGGSSLRPSQPGTTSKNRACSSGEVQKIGAKCWEMRSGSVPSGVPIRAQARISSAAVRY
jgi:hypothetical protein